jgi:peptide-methionine (S)-S-oxide reductase
MIERRAALCSLLLLTAALGVFARSAPAAVKPASATPPKPTHAYFAGGCFWSTESAFEGVKGVKSVVSGYTGGKEKNPSYEEVSSGLTGHLESVDVTYDPATISYDKLLDIFWHNIDPMQANGQFCDHGPNYHTAIFTLDSTQAAQARASKQKIEASKVLKAPIVTQILPASAFWPAEEYHQDFATKNPEHYRAYRVGCGRDARLDEIWGKDARRGSVPHTY